MAHTQPYDPRNEDSYDTWEVGMEPIPGDTTWHSTPVDVSPSDESVLKLVNRTNLKFVGH